MISENFKKRHEDLQAYFKSFRGQKKYSVQLSTLRTEAPEALRCPVSLEIMNIPVKLDTILDGKVHTHYFDMKSIWACEVYSKDGIDYRIHPLNRTHFTFADVMPAPEIQENIETFLTNMSSLPCYTPNADLALDETTTNDVLDNRQQQHATPRNRL